MHLLITDRVYIILGKRFYESSTSIEWLWGEIFIKNGEDELFNLLESIPVHAQNGVSLKIFYEHTNLFWSYFFSELGMFSTNLKDHDVLRTTHKIRSQSG